MIAAATLSHRYIADRFLPDKAIDLIDEAASKIRIEIDSLPTEIDEVDRRVMQLEIELTSLKKEKDAASKERRQAIERELAELKERSAAMKAQWQEEKDAIRGVSDLKERLERANGEMERAEREANLQRAAELRYGEIPELEKELAEHESTEPELDEDGDPAHPGPVFLKEEVDADDVAEIVAPLDRHPGQPSDGGRNREAGAHGGAFARKGRRPGRGDRGGRQRPAPLARGAAGPGPPDRLLPVPRPDGRRQDRAGAEHSRSSCSTPRTR